MSQIGDFFAISNSIDINELQRQQRVQMRVSEYNERAAAIAQRTGVTPKGFFAFEKENPTPAKRGGWRTLVWGAIFAVGALAISPTIPVILGAAAVGLAVGFILPESESSRMNRALDRYEGYIAQAEIAAESPSAARGLENTPAQARRVDHSASLLAERENAALNTASKGI